MNCSKLRYCNGLHHCHVELTGSHSASLCWAMCKDEWAFGVLSLEHPSHIAYSCAAERDFRMLLTQISLCLSAVWQPQLLQL